MRHSSLDGALSSGSVDRRQFLAIGVGAFVVAGLPIAVARTRSTRTTRRTIPVMGTIAEFAVVHPDTAVAQRAIDAAIRELRFVESTMTRFNDVSEIGRANLHASRVPSVIGAPTAVVVAEALRWADATNGAYDPAIGGAIALWDVEHRHEPPREQDREVFAARGLFRVVELDQFKQQPHLRFHEGDARLDLGAIAKGYGVDRAVAALREHGITKAVVDVGGDLYALGTAADNEPWQIGIQSPDDERALAGMLTAADVAIATSGTYRQFFKYRGVRYHHLLDPVTAAPRQTNVRSFTIRADSCMHADVAATALYGRTADDANRILARLAPGAHVDRIL
jgi:thiamine biosynthesis lipoprotein